MGRAAQPYHVAVSSRRGLPPSDTTPKQMADLERHLKSLRDANRGLSDSELLSTPKGQEILAAWRRHNSRMPEDQR